MALTLPRIVYPSGGSATLSFIYQPRFVPFKVYESIRHDNLSSAGLRESIWERTDEFFEFTMEYVKTGTDVVAWDLFMQSALQGLTFDYYPDGSLSDFTTYVLVDTTWRADYKQLGMHSFNVRFRRHVPWNPCRIPCPADEGNVDTKTFVLNVRL